MILTSSFHVPCIQMSAVATSTTIVTTHLNSQNNSLSSKLTHRSDLQTDSSDLGREDSQLEYHVVDGLLERRHFSLDLSVDSFRQTVSEYQRAVEAGEDELD